MLELSKWQKKLNIFVFKEKVPCPYCPKGSEGFNSNIQLCRHVLAQHNWNKDFLKGFEIVETHGSVMIVKEIEGIEKRKSEDKKIL